MKACEAAFADFSDAAETIGPIAFGALALLVAFLASFIELSRDKVVVTRGYYRELSIGTAVLALDTLLWVALEVGRRLPWQFSSCHPALLHAGGVAMYLGLGIATVLFWRFISSIKKLARIVYRD